MKTLRLIGAGLLAVAMTACQNEELPGLEEPAAPSISTTDGGYISVALSNPASGRSATYADGTEAENTLNLKQLRFFFYHADNTPFMMEGTNVNGSEMTNPDGSVIDQKTTNMICPLLVDGSNGNNASSFANAVLILGKSEDNGYQGAIPSKVICVANADDKTIAQYEGQTLDAVANILHEKVTDGTAGTFVMTSSTYYSNGKVYWSDITSANIASTPEVAKQHPVKIYIERLAAKIDVTKFPGNHIVKEPGSDNELVLSYVDYVNGQNVTVNDKRVWAEVSGWNVNTLATKSFGIKNIVNYSGDPAATHYFESADEWNDAANHRCFWASTVSQLNTADTETHIVPEQFKATATENDDATLWRGTNTPRYVFANTADPFVKGIEARGNDKFRGLASFARSRATKILVAAKFNIVEANASAAGDKPLNLMYWGGTYYTPEALCRSIAQWHNLDKPVVFARCNGAGNKKEADKDQHFNVRFYTKENGEWGTMAELTEQEMANNVINIDPAEYWNGMGYYIVNISNKTFATNQKLNGTAPEMFGVMRNHIYNYELTDFVGLGTPLPSVNDLTDVENPAFGETFVAAQLSVLNWRVVSHQTTLQ